MSQYERAEQPAQFGVTNRDYTEALNLARELEQENARLTASLAALEQDARRFNELFEKDYTHLYSEYWTQKLNEPNSPPLASEAAFLAALDSASKD